MEQSDSCLKIAACGACTFAVLAPLAWALARLPQCSGIE